MTQGGTMDDAAFTNLLFTISKPSWGTSTLVLSLATPERYELRLKRIVDGASVYDQVADYDVAKAAGLLAWLQSLGFGTQGSRSGKPVAGAGSWALVVSYEDDQDDSVQGGTELPAAFPDLLSTMIGLGLPGLQAADLRAFLSDFTRVAAPAAPAAAGGFPSPASSGALNLPGMPAEFGEAMAQMMQDPAKAEQMLRQQARTMPADAKRQLLELVKQVDPAHYDWWRRILLG